MRKSQLVELLQCLPESRWERFTLFLEARFHNNGPLRNDVIALWDLLKCHPDLLSREDNLSNDTVFQMLYPQKAVVAGKLEKVNSEMKTLLREFFLIEYQYTPENRPWRQLQWAKVLRNLHLQNQYDLQMAKTDRMLAEEDQLTLEWFLHRFLLEFERYFWAGSQNPGKAETNLANLIDSYKNLVKSYGLELANATLLRNTIVKTDLEDPFFQHLERDADTEEGSQHPIIVLSGQIFNMFKGGQPTLDDFWAMLNMLNQYESVLAKHTLTDYYTYLRNFCTILVNTSHPELVSVLHEIQKDNLARGLLYEEGNLSALRMLNINRVAIFLDDTRWALEFVQQHRGKIIGETPDESLYNINMAYCYFSLGQFEDVLSVLPDNCDNLIYYLFSRRLEIMAYYEIRSDLTDFKIDAFRMYLRRAIDKFLSEDLYEANISFIKMLQQLRSSAPGDKKRASKLRERIAQKAQLAETKWLMAKCDELAGDILP